MIRSFYGLTQDPFDARALPRPDHLEPVARPNEEHVPLALVSRRDHQDGLGLAEPAEVVEVGALAVLVLRVGVSHGMARRREDGDGLADPAREFVAPLTVDTHATLEVRPSALGGMPRRRPGQTADRLGRATSTSATARA